MKRTKYNNIEIFNKVSTLHIVMHYEKSCSQNLYFHASRTHKTCKKQPCVLWNLKSPKVIWKHATWYSIPNMNYFKLCSHSN
jgi:hypothetical protein